MRSGQLTFDGWKDHRKNPVCPSASITLFWLINTWLPFVNESLRLSWGIRYFHLHFTTPHALLRCMSHTACIPPLLLHQSVFCASCVRATCSALWIRATFALSVYSVFSRPQHLACHLTTSLSFSLLVEPDLSAATPSWNSSMLAMTPSLLTNSATLARVSLFFFEN